MMKWLFAVCSLAAFPALAVYQPTANEIALLEKLKKGTEQNLKYALHFNLKPKSVDPILISIAVNILISITTR
jgi:hypothetical protein